MSSSTVYVLVYAERFSAVTEGIFSTREKAEAFLAKRLKLDEILRAPDRYEIREEQVDELDDAFKQYGAITYLNPDNNEIMTQPLGDPDLVAKLDETEHLRYTDGKGAIITYGVDYLAAAHLAEIARSEAGDAFFQPQPQSAE